MSTRGSYYKTDLALAYSIRAGLLVGICVLAYTLGGCALNETAALKAVGSEALSLGADKVDSTRNYEPPNDGGCNEKSDRAPLRPLA